jgi:hypothetical protein
MLFGERVAVYCENHIEHTNTLCGQNAEIQSGTHSNHSDVKVYVQIINIINSITEEDCGC